MSAVASEYEHIFLFVNPNSGGRVGEAFLAVAQPFHVQLDDVNDTEVSLNIYNVNSGKEGNKPGFHALRRETAKGRVVRVIVGGGDGTVIRVVREAERHGINAETQIHMGIVPLGTGNDFSQHLGWGFKNPSRTGLLANDCEMIERLVQSWCKARPAMHDVWRLSLNVHEDDGEILQKETKLDVLSVDTPMLLYCGVAKDAEVAYQVELRRTNRQWCNKLVYVLMGLRSMMHVFCCRGQRVRRVISGMYAGTSSEAPVIFEGGRKSGAPRLRSNPEMLLVLNQDSYAAGQGRRLWDTSYRLGVRDPLDEELLEREQSPGDFKLEVLTLRRLCRLVMPTRDLLSGRRVYQGAPIHLKFRRRKDLLTYIQVDGESYKLKNPSSLTIEHRQQISVLHRVPLPSNLSGFSSMFGLFSCASGQDTDSPSDSEADGDEEPGEDTDTDDSRTPMA